MIPGEGGARLFLPCGSSQRAVSIRLSLVAAGAAAERTVARSKPLVTEVDVEEGRTSGETEAAVTAVPVEDAVPGVAVRCVVALPTGVYGGFVVKAEAAVFVVETEPVRLVRVTAADRPESTASFV